MAIPEVAVACLNGPNPSPARTDVKVSTVFYMNHLPLYQKEKPYFLNVPVDAGSELAQTNVGYTRQQIHVANIRGCEHVFTLDQTGFQLGKLQTKLTYEDFADSKAIAKRFFPEVQQFLREALGASEVLTFDYQVRRRDPSLPRNSRGAVGKAQPFASVHADQTASSAMRRLEYFHPEWFDKYKNGRVQIVNIWKPLHGPTFDAPLAVCDYRTVEDADRVPTDVVFPDYLGETYNFWPNPNHKWYYVDGQMPDEAWMIKCFDSKTAEDPDVSQFAPHVSFPYRDAPPGTLPRESVEVRNFVFYSVK
ncbi:hypothetical protein BU16DRAFT_519476 [Lophium mytilinum]|uniref:CmcJ-like methyltransferase n=1 Tax=Lophium mytilinum TaxID=390894 RepID=A0A6A6QCQ8_9PEZI|nr:hypothetical protein BU16DRAFT_519476 [Lophium mytilinum]